MNLTTLEGSRSPEPTPKWLETLPLVERAAFGHLGPNFVPTGMLALTPRLSRGSVFVTMFAALWLFVAANTEAQALPTEHDSTGESPGDGNLDDPCAVEGAVADRPWHDDRHWNSVALTAGLTSLSFRDEALSPLRHGGPTPELAITLDAFAEPRIDRFAISWARKVDGNWKWLYLDASWFYTRRVAQLRSWDFFVGYDWENSFGSRTYVDTLSWNAQSTFGLGVGARHVIFDRANALLFEARASTPLLGVIGRSGWGSTFQENGLSTRDLFVASPHNTLGGSFDVSLLWLRPTRGDLRIELESWMRQVNERHRLRDAGTSLSLSWYWRL